MNYLSITKCDQLNGDGLRVTLFVSGCDHECRECQNAYSWKPDRGVPFDNSTKEEIYKELSKDWCSGLTLSGGDPMFRLNRETVINFCKEVKEKFPKKTIWMYTGYTIGQVSEDPTMRDVLKYIDVIVDGEFDCKQKSRDVKWAGSSNQRVIKIKNDGRSICSI